MKIDPLLTHHHNLRRTDQPCARSAWLRQLTMVAIASVAAMGSALLAQTAPSSSPLLVGSAGAKPNLMISLDNSGSMAFSFQETYGIYSDNNNAFELRRCPDNAWSDLSNAWVAGGIADFRNGHRCIYRGGDGNYYYSTTISLAFVPAATTAGSWVAQRSARVNPLYYDPRVTYLPRVGPDGNPLVPGDGIVFVSNQNSTNFSYRVLRNDANTAEIRTQHSIYAANPAAGAGWTEIYALNYNHRIPQHIAYTSANVAGATAFTYVTCNDVISVAGQQVGCRAWSPPVNILPGNPATIPLPVGHKRTDCGGGTSCTNSQEITNILNWYRYYLFRAPAVATAVGQALANPNYDDRIRVGYTLINERNNATIGPNNRIPGATTDRPLQLRGVRTHRMGSADTSQIYTWLYDQDGTQNRHSNLGTAPAFDSMVNRRQAPGGGTPLHNTINRVARYYRVDTAAGVTENAWRTNPLAVGSDSNQEMVCRRSFNLLFSDGAWNSGTSSIAGQDYDNTDGPFFSRTLASGASDSFRYLRNGLNTAAGRQMYTPYPSSATGGLADLTAQYFWHEDLRAIDNGIQTRAGQPTFWQNMATYTVGYLIRPSGEVPGATSGLTFNQITNYQAQYASAGYAAATKPSWATGDVNSAASDQTRVDDFIQAGFTGGGQGFSVTTADDVRRAFQIILSDIVNSSGRDAGVAVSSSGADTSSIAGNLKYNVSYRTLDNSGDVIAQELDAVGNVVNTTWEASKTIPAPASRRMFSMSGQNSPVNFEGDFSSLPSDIRDALRAGPEPARIPSDARFVNYLRGLDPVTDAQGRLFRQRSGKMGAMVNPPSIHMGADTDFAYDRISDLSAISGSSSYETYVRNKVALPASLFVATNAGQVHSFNAATGAELAVFMPRRSLKRMLNYARDDYAFEYVLDGPLSEHDIYDGAKWNHVAVGTGGRGERLIYALRSPLNTTAAPVNREPGRLDFLWETGPDAIDSTDFSMGYITNPARSGQTRNGDWVILVNSGHYNGQSDGSRHGLLVLDARDGNVLKRIPLPAGYSAGRGLSGITAVRDSDKRIVAAYAGDANGNLWRFDLKGSRSEWGVSYNKPLFTEPNNRPIYGAPAWQASRLHKDGGALVVIATGMLLDDNDPADVSRSESIYGIWDPTPIGGNDVNSFATRQANDLLLQSVVTTAGVAGAAGNEFFKTSEQRYDPKVHKGWRLPLNRETGERNIDQIRNLGSNVLIATTVIKPPADPNAEMCRVSDLPTNYLYVLDAQTGGMPKRALDQDGDGKLDAYSIVRVIGGGYSRGMAMRVTFKGDLWSGDLRKRRNTQADEGEGTTETKCLSTTARLIGTEGGSIAAGSSCTSGWNRSQYQLVQPPA